MNNSTNISDAIFKYFRIPAPEREYKFMPDRKFRIDFYWPDVKLAVEIEGGVWTRGRHTRGSGFIRDAEKYNLMTEHGIALLRYTPSGIDFEQIKRVYDALRG